MSKHFLLRLLILAAFVQLTFCNMSTAQRYQRPGAQGTPKNRLKVNTKRLRRPTQRPLQGPTRILKPQGSSSSISAAQARAAMVSVFGKGGPTEPITNEERVFLDAYKSAVNSAATLVKANPQNQFQPSSMTARIQQASQRVHRKNATSVGGFSGSTRFQRGKSSRRFTQQTGVSRRNVNSQIQMSVDMLSKLRMAVRARLNAKKGEIINALKTTSLESTTFASGSGVSTALKPNAGLPQTWIQAGFFSGDVHSSPKTKITLNSPAELDFRWGTRHRNAEEGYWQLVKVANNGGRNRLVAAGNAGNAPQNLFSINFANYLPPQPSTEPQIYHVRVLPRTKKTISQTGTSPSSGGSKIPAKQVGPWSLPVVITYAKSTLPPQQFDFPEVYRKAYFILDRIDLVQDQYGPGREEYHIAGFVQENFGSQSASVGQQYKLGSFFAKLNPPSYKHFGAERAFHLNNPNQPEWPRVLTTVISVLEEDHETGDTEYGSSIDDWTKEMWEFADSALDGPIGDAIQEEIDEFIEELIKDGLHLAADAAQIIASAVSEALSASIVGMAAAIAVHIVVAVIDDLEDDFYGCKAMSKVLPTNHDEFIEGLPGQFTSGGRFRLSTDTLRFKGPPPANSASAFDGIVDIKFHWEFGNKQVVDQSSLGN